MIVTITRTTSAITSKPIEAATYGGKTISTGSITSRPPGDKPQNGSQEKGGADEQRRQKDHDFILSHWSLRRDRQLTSDEPKGIAFDAFHLADELLAARGM